MTDQKITQLTEVTTVADDDLLVTVTNPATTPATKGIKMSNLRARLKNSAASVTTSNITATVNTRYVLDISGLTANRNFIIPTGSDYDEISVNISTGDDTYFLIIIGDTGITINNGSAATEFCRLQKAGSNLTFTRTSSTNWNCTSGTVSNILLGTPTNNSAATGYIGEYVEGAVAEASKITLTTNVVSELTSITLTAGDWDVTALSEFQTGTATNVTILLGNLSTTSATLDTTAGRLSTLTFGSSGLAMTNSLDISVINPVYRFSLSTTTTIYLNVRGNFTVSTLKAWGILRARRVR